MGVLQGLGICMVAVSCWAQSYTADEWKRQIAVRLHSKAHLPRDACGKSGKVEVSFTMDRSGNLMSTSIGSGSGVPALDNAALEMVKGAQPFPPAPPEAANTDLKTAVVMDFREPAGASSCDPLDQERLRGVMRSICRGCQYPTKLGCRNLALRRRAAPPPIISVSPSHDIHRQARSCTARRRRLRSVLP
jgi:TonB family protein